MRTITFLALLCVVAAGWSFSSSSPSQVLSADALARVRGSGDCLQDFQCGDVGVSCDIINFGIQCWSPDGSECDNCSQDSPSMENCVVSTGNECLDLNGVIPCGKKMTGTCSFGIFCQGGTPGQEDCPTNLDDCLSPCP